MSDVSASTNLEVYRSPDELYVVLNGRVVLEECEVLRRELVSRILPGIERVFVDLSAVDFIDSAGLGLLVGLKMTSKKNGARIILIQPGKTVSDVLYVSKLDGIFEFLNGADAVEVKNRLVKPEFQQDRKVTGTSEWSQNPLDTAFPRIGGLAAASSGGVSVNEGMDREAVEEHCRKAVEFMREGNYEQSVEEYRNALAIAPDYLPALNNLAIVYEKQPLWHDKAVEQWEKVLKLSEERNDTKHRDRASRHLETLRKD